MSATPPTAKQLAYLRALANRAGQTFIYPRTRAQASREIERLRTANSLDAVEKFLETADLDAENAA